MIPYYGRLLLGVSSATQNQPGTSIEVKRDEGVFDFTLDYGSPGASRDTNTNGRLTTQLQITGSTAVGIDVMTRGLLLELISTAKPIRGSAIQTVIAASSPR